MASVRRTTRFANIVTKLLKEFPAPDAQLIVCEASQGVNNKVGKLAHLETLAKHDVLIISDSDVCVPRDFLTNLVAPLRDEKVGLVNCFYQLANPTTLAMRWEAIAINADFWSQVLQSQSLKPLDFALGPAMATRRKQLAEIGGFDAIVNCLADDYQLGNRIARSRLSHRILSHRGRMLVGTHELARSLETSVALGANDSGVPARAVFFQHFKQRYALAACVAGRKSVKTGTGCLRGLLACAFAGGA